MKKLYVTPDAEFIRITGDALTGSNPNSDNNSTPFDDLKDFDPDSWDDLF